ncbi:hypothetical protein Q7C_1844 [Methylophaga frappieri]|uniref:Uncharacterized protein n=1 Tax=Methylophaga frappieri (strain ATCC BAA-2434 / DSM 25690 / JAM7) TaxID=754477 RepID=I1YJ92_METFJ|nr:hypothetical protein Q7C_1844 [Methylophaga frappieri]
MILDAIQKQFPESDVISANIEIEDNGDEIYEIQGTLKDKRKFEYDTFANGEVQEIEVEFPEYMVPEAVMKAIEKKLPGFTPTYIEASHSKSMKVISYEFEGMMGDKKLDIDVSADGSKIEIADS